MCALPDLKRTSLSNKDSTAKSRPASAKKAVTVAAVTSCKTSETSFAAIAPIGRPGRAFITASATRSAAGTKSTVTSATTISAVTAVRKGKSTYATIATCTAGAAAEEFVAAAAFTTFAAFTTHTSNTARKVYAPLHVFINGGRKIQRLPSKLDRFCHNSAWLRYAYSCTDDNWRTNCIDEFGRCRCKLVCR